MIKINGKIKLSLDVLFAKVPQLGHAEEWKPIEEIREHDVVWLKTKTDYYLAFGASDSIVVMSEPIIKENLVEFDFTNFVV